MRTPRLKTRYETAWLLNKQQLKQKEITALHHLLSKDFQG